MKTICLCLLALMVLSATTPAYADSVLWSSEHESTELQKDETWIEEQMASQDISVDLIEGIDEDVEVIDAMGVMDGDSLATPADLDIISTTTEGESAPVEPVVDEAEPMVTTLDLIEDTGEETDNISAIVEEQVAPVSDISSMDVKAEQMNVPVIIEGEAESQ